MASSVAKANRLSARAYCRRHAFARSSSSTHLGIEVRGHLPRSSPMPYGSHRVAVDFVVGRYYECVQQLGRNGKGDKSMT
jgi:hypothetical protein